MSTYTQNSPFALPLMMTRLAMASWETIFHRSVMMATGTCSAAEYQLMAVEKVEAMQTSMLALARGRSQTAVLAPFVGKARGNAKRLRRASL